MDLSFIKLDIKHLSDSFVNEKLESKWSETVLKSPFKIPTGLTETFTLLEATLYKGSFFEVNAINTHFHL